MAYNKTTNEALNNLENMICEKYAWTGGNDIYTVIEALNNFGKDTDIELIWKVHDEIVEKLNN